MARAVLDASAVLALLNDEPGADVVEALLPEAAVSAVNYAEVIGKLLEAGVPERDAIAAAQGLGLAVVPFDGEAAVAAARLRLRTKAAGLSLGDRACLALAASLGVPAVTADRAWRGVDAGARVRFVRRR